MRYQVVLPNSAFMQRVNSAFTPATIWARKPDQLTEQITPLPETTAEQKRIRTICIAIQQVGGRALIVGGYVRDCLLGHQSKDIDIEVFGLSPEQLTTVLKQFGTVSTVGEQFGVWLIHGLDVDFSLPRTDSKTGHGHRGFTVDCDPFLSYEDAARRRDLTINALSLDPLTGDIIDPFHGRADLQAGRLRAVDTNTFGDDPLRALRAVRFAATLGFLPDEELLTLMCQQNLRELSAERLWTEWHTIARKSVEPVLAFLCLEDANLLHYFPELDALRDVPQSTTYHPEGDVYVHTALVCQEAAQLRGTDHANNALLFFAALCHDLGKPKTTVYLTERDHYTARGHEKAGLTPTVSLLQSIKAPNALTDLVCALVEHHLKPICFPQQNAGPAAYRRLAYRLHKATCPITALADIARADQRGRTTEQDTENDIQTFVNTMTSLAETCSITPLVQGRHLIAHNMKPGKKLGKALTLCFQYQQKTGCTDIEKIIRAALPKNK